MVEGQRTFREYGIAPLDALSLTNGVAKFDHLQHTLPTKFIDYAFSYLDACFPLAAVKSHAIDKGMVQEILLNDEHADKASGYPWCFLGAPTKEQAVKKFPEFAQYEDSVVNCTLKDEIRLVGKDSRLFRPASLHDYYEGLTLFYSITTYMQSLLLTSPIFTRFVHPGVSVSQLFAALQRHGGKLNGADGAQWDAHFPTCVAELLMNWRLRHAPAELHSRIRKYYSNMYYGWTNCAGNLIHLEGQPSGHFLTTIDNSLCQMVCMAYHAWRSGMSISSFHKEVLYFCCGDDLVWSDKSGLFSPAALDGSYSDLGCYLEFQSLESVNLEDLVFVGQTCVIVDNVVRYHGKIERTQATTEYRMKTATPVDYLQKLAMCCINMRFGPTYSWHLSLLYDRFNSYVSQGLITEEDQSVLSAIHIASPDRAASLYDRFETVDFKAPPPFKICYGKCCCCWFTGCTCNCGQSSGAEATRERNAWGRARRSPRDPKF